MDKLIKYLNSLAKPEQVAFADACGTSVGYLRKAASSGQLLNIATCVAVERVSSGEVTRVDLRPDDWQANWPELAARYTRRATDSTPGLGHCGRQPASPHNILDTVPDGAVVVPTTGDA